jgi:UDP-3-O-[3-hydroxymyristoyl] N-acetylglucosamine deacetylase
VKEAWVEGVGLHSGVSARVGLRACAGPVTLAVGDRVARIDELHVASTARATTVEAHGGALRVATVEHLFAALAGLGVYEGLAIRVDGPELPLLDGGASAWCAAIEGLHLAAALPRARIVREAVVDVGGSRYELSPGEHVDVGVAIAFEGFDATRISPEARWRGDATDFRARIAPARTFALTRDIGELAAAGLARGVDPSAVVLLAPDAVHSAGRPFSSDEPARHKLLDLVGDLYLTGGPPLGRLRAVRPGHAANAHAMKRAFAEGILVADQERVPSHGRLAY